MRACILGQESDAIRPNFCDCAVQLTAWERTMTSEETSKFHDLPQFFILLISFCYVVTILHGTDVLYIFQSLNSDHQLWSILGNKQIRKCVLVYICDYTRVFMAPLLPSSVFHMRSI